MALGDNYVTDAALKARLGITDTQDDTRISGAVSTASRSIEKYCRRQFNLAAGATTRKFYTGSKYRCIVDDFSTTTGLAISAVSVTLGTESETALGSTEYRLEPLDGVREGVTGWPWWLVRVLGSTTFPTTSQGYVKVTAQWGWATVPAPIIEATLILAEEYFKLKEAPWGVANWGEFGPIRVQDNRKLVNLLRDYRRGGPQVR